MDWADEEAMIRKLNMAIRNMSEQGTLSLYWSGMYDGMITALHILGYVPMFDEDDLVSGLEEMS